MKNFEECIKKLESAHPFHQGMLLIQTLQLAANQKIITSSQMIHAMALVAEPHRAYMDSAMCLFSGVVPPLEISILSTESFCIVVGKYEGAAQTPGLAIAIAAIKYALASKTK